jgi:hydroxyacylglutathione hydrolase
MKTTPWITGALGAALLLSGPSASAQLAPGSLDVEWSEGAEHCEAGPPQAPIQVHPYDARTFILRESLCATFEAPFIYLLLGSARALLIDTGAVEDAKVMPLAATVQALLPSMGASTMPLLVLHTHRHLDHRAGDPQFANLPGVEVVPAFLEDVQKHFGFENWPEGLAQVELGDRTVDVMPAPGHNSTHVAFYDRNTGLFFSGDFLLPGRLLVEDGDQYLASAKRVTQFIATRPVTHVLGAHIELSRQNELFPWKSTHHPHEHALALTKEDLLALPALLQGFNGFYTRQGTWVLTNPDRQLMVVGAGAVLLLVASAWWVWRYFRRRRRARPYANSPSQ